MGWSKIIFNTDKNVESRPINEYNILVTNVQPGSLSLLTNMMIRQMLIAPSNVYILSSLLCFMYYLANSRVGLVGEISSSLYYLSFNRISFMLLILWWCSKLLPSILKIILHRAKKYLLALKYLYFSANQQSSTSMLMPQMMLSKKLEMLAMMLQSMPTIFIYKGFFDSIFLTIDAIWSMKFRNLNILRAFFIELRSFKATKAARIELVWKAFCTYSIYEYLRQWQQKSEVYWMKEQILSRPLHVFMSMVKTDTQEATYLPQVLESRAVSYLSRNLLTGNL